MPTDSPALAVRLDCTVNLGPQALEITMVLKNDGSTDAGVFNRIQTVHPDGTIDFSAHVAYVEFQQGVLLVRKMALPVPEGLNMAAYVPPFASRLRAGDKLVDVVRLPIPVRVMQPFRRALLKGQVVADQPAHALSLMVAVGVFPVDDAVQLVADNPAFPDVFTATPPGPAVARQVVLSRPFPLRQSVPVLDYRVVPWP